MSLICAILRNVRFTVKQMFLPYIWRTFFRRDSFEDKNWKKKNQKYSSSIATYEQKVIIEKKTITIM